MVDEKLVRRAMKEGRPVSADLIEKAAGRYSDRLLQLRGEVIARTEALQSFHAAQEEGILQVVDAGAVRQDQVRRTWDAALDAKTRPTHAAANGQTVGLQEPFVVGGYRMMRPGDSSMGAPAGEVVACRCRVRMDVDYIAGLGPGD